MTSESMPTIEIVKITPAMAAEMLERNFENNRNLSTAVVDSYAKDMRDGNWKLTGDPVRTDVDGRVIDGQHRLAACVQADVPFVTAVMSNVEHGVVSVLDVGRGRTLRDAFRVAGFGSAADGTALAIPLVVGYERYMMDKVGEDGEAVVAADKRSSLSNTKYPYIRSVRVSRPDAFAIVDRRPTLTESAKSVTPATYHRRSQPVRPNLGLATLMHNIAEYGYGGSSVIEFIETVRSGIGTVTDPTFQLHQLIARHLMGKPGDQIERQTMELLWFRAYAQWTGELPTKNLRRTRNWRYPVIAGDVEWSLLTPSADGDVVVP